MSFLCRRCRADQTISASSGVWPTLLRLIGHRVCQPLLGHVFSGAPWETIPLPYLFGCCVALHADGPCRTANGGTTSFA